ncbi:probable ethanolamine kinase [Oppia nitens]|uniref:probable ethanolamine kinase n=1 Tax=Oppia nitens TaxID=1686743 RepID=UPI0023DB4204|nr:probable ethanolamine kinase [Oppia nitens]
MDKCDSVHKLDVFLSHSNLEDGVVEVIKFVRNEWSENKIKLKVFTDGITNRLIGAYLEDKPNDMILIRVYGEKTELFIDRKQEVLNMRTMYKSGLIPPVYCTFNNGICYGYSPGVVLDENMVRDTHISKLISEMMARMHTIKPQMNRLCNQMNDCTPEPVPSLFKGLRKFLDLIPCALKDPQQDKRYKKFLPNKENLISEVNSLELTLKKLLSPVVFCHNDLLLKNIVFNADKNNVTFIDFEYGDYNYQAFDIANHFCEFAGVDTFNPCLYPNKDFQKPWLRHYLKAWFSLKDRSLSANAIEMPSIDIEVEKLYNQVNQFAMAAHLVWGLWAIVQSEHSTINFDFLGYGIQRLREYYKIKDKFVQNGEIYH